MPPQADIPVRLSIVSPAHNEAENVERLVEEVGRAGQAVLALVEGGGVFEFILVDDGSTDATRAIAQRLMPTRPWLRIIAMTDTPQGKGGGQSAAFWAGFHAARGELIAVLDADLQNDPGDLVAMYELMQRESADMVQGDRSRARKDNVVRRVGSVVGRRARGWILGDTIRDTGCSLRLMKREIATAIPLEYKGVHRFIPALARQLDYNVVEMPVSHRPRIAGETKYGMGIIQRALPGLVDCFAIRWMSKRRKPIASMEIERAGAERAALEPQQQEAQA